MSNPNPTRIIAEALHDVNEKSGDPRLTFVNLLSAALIAGKFIGLSRAEIALKLAEIEGPADIVRKQITGE